MDYVKPKGKNSQFTFLRRFFFPKHDFFYDISDNISMTDYSAFIRITQLYTEYIDYRQYHRTIPNKKKHLRGYLIEKI